MKKMNVMYTLTDAQYGRLKRVIDLYKGKGVTLKEEEVFEAMMLPGADMEINNRIDIQERLLGKI